MEFIIHLAILFLPPQLDRTFVELIGEVSVK